MSRKYYDDFSKMPVDKMAQSISDMTYSYKGTMVPKKHYKDILDKELQELASNDINIERMLLQPYIDMMSKMLKENSKYFYKALLMVELKAKDTAVEIDAINTAYDAFDDSKLKNILNEDIVEVFENVKKNGVYVADEEEVN